MIKRECHTIRYGDILISYRIKWLVDLSDRVRIHVDPDANVLVEAPYGCESDTVRHVLQTRARWICDQLREIAVWNAHILPREYVSGESHLYLGRRYMLKVLAADNNNPPGVKLTGAFLKVWIDENAECPSSESVRHLLRKATALYPSADRNSSRRRMLNNAHRTGRIPVHPEYHPNRSIEGWIPS